MSFRFHVSSACKESQVYVHALSDARCVFDMAGEFGLTMNMLDIGGGFTGTKDSNFTKDQANEGRYYKPNSLKLTLINPLGWRKHEEIWGNLVSLKLGLSDLEKYLHPPNDTDVLVSSYLK